MPTKKPVIQAVLENEDLEVLDQICKEYDRSRSKMISIILKEYIEQYKSNQAKDNLKSLNSKIS